MPCDCGIMGGFSFFFGKFLFSITAVVTLFTLAMIGLMGWEAVKWWRRW